MAFRCHFDLRLCSLCFSEHPEHELCDREALLESVPPPFFLSCARFVKASCMPLAQRLSTLRARVAQQVAKAQDLRAFLYKESLRAAIVFAARAVNSVALTSVAGYKQLHSVWSYVVVYHLSGNAVVPTHVLRGYPLMMQARASSSLDDNMQMQRELNAATHIPPPPEVIELLRDRGRNTHVPNAGDSHLARTPTQEERKKKVNIYLKESDVFHTQGIVEKYMPQLFQRESGHKILPEMVIPEDHCTVYYPPPMPDGAVNCFSPIATTTSDHARRLTERGWRNTDVVATVLSIQSHVPLGTPVSCMCIVRDSRTTNVEESILCGALIDLGSNKAKMINLPLVNFMQNPDDFDAYMEGLTLCVMFFHVKGYRVGTPMFTYSVLNFLEHKRTTYTDETLVRGTWEEITRRNNAGDKTRIVSGLGILNTMEKDIHQAMPDIPICNIPVFPNMKPSTMQINHGKVTNKELPRSSSFRIGRVGASQATGRDCYEQPRNSDVGVRANHRRRGKQAVQFPLEPTSDSDGSHCKHYSKPTGDDEMELESRGASSGLDVVFPAIVTIPADAKKGKLIGSLDFRRLASTFNSAVWTRWTNAGLFKPKLVFKVYAPNNGFSGLAISMHADLYRAFPVDKFSVDSIYADMGFVLPSYLFSFREGTSEAIVDLDELCGHNFSVYADSMSQLLFYITVATTNQVTFASAWRLRIVCSVLSEPEMPSFALKPLVTLPLDGNQCSRIDRFLGPFSFPLGKESWAKVPLTLAEGKTFGGYTSYSFSNALLSHWQGVGGTLCGRIVPTSSIFVSCTLLLGMYPTSIDRFGQLMRQPHCILENGGEFELELRSPFGTINVHSETNSCFLYICSMSGPLAPKDYTAKYEFFLYLDSIKEILFRTPTSLLDGSFLWCTISKILEDEKDFPFQGKLTDLISEKATIVPNYNPFGLLVATTGMHRGKLRLTANWSCKGKMGEVAGHVELASRYSVDIQGHKKVASAWVGSLSLDLEFGSQAGPVSVMSDLTTNWARLWTNCGKSLFEITISVQPIGGFEFYGRSAHFVEAPRIASEEPVKIDYRGTELLVTELEVVKASSSGAS